MSSSVQYPADLAVANKIAKFFITWHTYKCVHIQIIFEYVKITNHSQHNLHKTALIDWLIMHIFGGYRCIWKMSYVVISCFVQFISINIKKNWIWYHISAVQWPVFPTESTPCPLMARQRGKQWPQKPWFCNSSRGIFRPEGHTG